MNVFNAAEAFEWLAHGPLTLERMQKASEELRNYSQLNSEPQWLNDAIKLLGEACLGHASLLQRAVMLPELQPARMEYAREVQNAWVDALEKLHAGITYHAGSRAPILEVLYPRHKFSTLRRGAPASVIAYQQEFEKRANGSYVQRMLASGDFEFSKPIFAGVRENFARWEVLVSETQLPHDEAFSLRQELLSQAKEFLVPYQQSRFLAQAALFPLPNVYENLEIGAKPKRKSIRPSEAAPAPCVDETLDSVNAG